jgi:hypothetical protein
MNYNDTDFIEEVSELSQIKFAESNKDAPEKRKNRNKQNHKKEKKQSFVSELDTEVNQKPGEKENLNIGIKVLEKRNSELSALSDMIINKNYDENLIQRKILKSDRNLYEFNFQSNQSQNEEKTEKDDFEKLQQLEKFYIKYEELTNAQKEAIIQENFELLNHLFTEKDTILEKIQTTQNTINYKKISLSEEKKIKANTILSDIHNRMSGVIQLEDENNSRLCSLKNEMKVALGKIHKGSQMIAKYGNKHISSHFIDKKT